MLTSASPSPRALRVFETCRRTANLDVALEREALVVGGHFQRRGVDLDCPMIMWSAEKFVASTVDRVIGRARREIRLERHGRAETVCAHRAAGRGGIERRAGGVAQPVHGQEFGGGRNRTFELEAHARRAGRMGRGVRHLELDRPSRVSLRPADISAVALFTVITGGAPDDVHGEIGVVQDRTFLPPAATRNSLPAVEQSGRHPAPAFFQPLSVLNGCIHRVPVARSDGAALRWGWEENRSLSKRRHDEDRPEPLGRLDRPCAMPAMPAAT